MRHFETNQEWIMKRQLRALLELPKEIYYFWKWVFYG